MEGCLQTTSTVFEARCIGIFSNIYKYIYILNVVIFSLGTRVFLNRSHLDRLFHLYLIFFSAHILKNLLTCKKRIK